ncbi:MAG: thioredoxin-disulfide reductase [Peptostreptococcaceae bacterium]|nr:thioredoxin-disulfide reductase [Peptostreptococcaceae bacterium]
MEKIYDVIIVGAGPAGLTAAIYSGRARLSTLIIEKANDGGQIVQTSEIVNYPGGIKNESGVTLTERMAYQAKAFGAEKTYDTVKSVQLSGDIKVLNGERDIYKAKTVIIAAGAFPVGIGCSNEKEFNGKGISYCATCDGAFFEDFEIYVVGGGDSAVEEAIYLTRFARKVTIIHRRDELRAVKSIQEKAFANDKIEYMWNSRVIEVRGEGMLQSMIVEDTKTKETKEIFADEDDGLFGLFVFIGFKPQSEIFEGKMEIEKGYIVTDENMKTSLPGVFAAGDIRKKSLRQVVTATGDGAIAADQAVKYIDELNI